ncbi:MAG TPA: SBBP repeat-containing protein, partial [Acidimicrobiales bacterium]|nr:SBBP repeat-containing protein [Acidimicrobiales bacterium]
GNVYTTGRFATYYSSGTVDFDPGAGTAGLPSNGSYDAFVSKLDSSGDYVWAKSLGGPAGDYGYSVAVDSSGNVYTTGLFHSGGYQGAVDFDPGAGTLELIGAGTAESNLNGGTDAFVWKLDSSGNLVTGAGVTVALSGGSTAVSEAGSTDSFTVVLNAQPSSDVVLSVVSADTGEATVSPTQLTFTNSNWDTAQTVTVTGVDDSAVDGTQTTAVTVAVVDGSSDDAYDAVVDSTVSVTTSDDDTAAFVLSGTSVTVSEAGSTATFTVVLGAQPSSDVALSVVSADTGEATVSTAQLTFTSGNWNAAQAVTVTGVDDSATDGNQTTAVTVAVVDASSDNAFDALADQTVTATTSDDDSPGVSVSESDGSTGTTESGGTDTFTVVLNTQPSSDVVVSVASSDTGEVTVAPATVTFTSGNWNTAQTITVTGVADTVVDGTQNATVTLSVVDASSDDAYDSVADVAVSVTNDDVDSTVATTTTTTTTTAPSVSASVVLSVVAAESDAFLSWVPSPAGGVQSHLLAWRDPSGNWSTHSTYDSGVIPEDTLFDLADGTHSFQILTSYTDGNSVLSNTESITVPTPPPGPTVNPELIEVGPFDCAAFPSLIQVMGTPGVGHSVKQLDLNTGEYSEIFSIPFDRTPSYTHLNGIGINPVDGALYGLMQVQGFGYLVRFDAAGNVAFVARVPAMSNAGDVDAQGRFMWDSERTNFYVLSGIADMEGFADPGDAADKSKITPVVTGVDGVADVAALSVDLGAGERPYAMGVNGRNHKLQIWSYDNQPEAWIIDLFENGSPAQLTNGGFGAAWSHDDRIYFASNSGAGVYEVLIDTIDLNAKTADIRRVANSQATAINDGTTCIGIDVPPPGPTVNPELIEVGPFDCAAYPALIQIMGKTNSGMEVKQLDIASGEYTEIYSIPFDRTPPF